MFDIRVEEKIFASIYSLTVGWILVYIYVYIYIFFTDDEDEEEAPAPKAKAKAVKQAKKEESDDEEDDEDDDEESSEGIWSLSKITSTQYISLCPAEVFNF